MCPSIRFESQSQDLEYWYSGFLIPRDVSGDIAKQLADFQAEVPGLQGSARGLEYEYRGRDTNRQVVRMLVQLAKIVVNADGEIRCQVSGDIDQLWFEFFRIRNARLFRQRADLVRHGEQEVTDSGGTSTAG